MAQVRDNINIENAKIIFRNFKGEGSKYNRQGAKNFCVIIDDPEMAEELLRAGWNIRKLPARSEDEEEVYYLQVSVSFDNIPPKVPYHGEEQDDARCRHYFDFGLRRD